jgi:hypothetical protein
MFVKTIETAAELQNEFRSFNRDYYSYEAYETMIEWENEYPVYHELDIIALCGVYNEETPQEVINNYETLISKNGVKLTSGKGTKIDIDALVNFLNEYTFATVLDNGNILYIAF